MEAIIFFLQRIIYFIPSKPLPNKRQYLCNFLLNNELDARISLSRRIKMLNRQNVKENRSIVLQIQGICLNFSLMFDENGCFSEKRNKK